MGIFSRLKKLERNSNQLRVDLASHLFMDKVVSCGGFEFYVKAIMIDKDDDIVLCGGEAFEIYNIYRTRLDYPIKINAHRCKIVNEEDNLGWEINTTLKKQKADEVIKGLVRTIASLTNYNHSEIETVISANEFLDSE